MGERYRLAGATAMSASRDLLPFYLTNQFYIEDTGSASCPTNL